MKNLLIALMLFRISPVVRRLLLWGLPALIIPTVVFLILNTPPPLDPPLTNAEIDRRAAVLQQHKAEELKALRERLGVKP